MAPAKHWCFTLNNPTVDDAMVYEMVSCWPIEYVAVQREVGESGTEHLQGYVEFEKPQRLSSIKKLPLAGMCDFLLAQSKIIFTVNKKF